MRAIFNKREKKEFELLKITMNERNFITQINMGVDQHGHNGDCTNAAIKAIKNAISNNCLTGLSEICGLNEPKDLLRMKVHVKIGAPYPENIDEEKVLKAIPLGEKSIEVVQGGLIAKGIMIKELGDTSDQIIVCNAAVTVSISDN
jgi:uncharacterized protein (TIGR02058 family)